MRRKCQRTGDENNYERRRDTLRGAGKKMTHFNRGVKDKETLLNRGVKVKDPLKTV